MMTGTRLFVFGVLGLGLAACGGTGEDGSPTPGEDLLAEACEHMAEGPSSAVTAGADAAGAPDVSEGHTRYDVALVDVAGGKGGFAAYAAPEAGDYVFFLNKDVGTFAVQDASGAAVAIEESVTSGFPCAEVVSSHTIELAVGTYYLSFGPTTETSVSLVAEASEGHDHEE